MTGPDAVAEVPDAILACFDGSEGARRALWWAAGEAWSRGRPLVAVQSFEWDVPLTRTSAEPTGYDEHRIREAAEREFDRVAVECQDMFVGLSVRLVTPEGPPELTVVELAERMNPELVVAGASGRGTLSRMLLGSTAAELARNLRQPLVVVRGEPAPADAPVVVGVDGSATSDRAVEFALDFAERHGVRVRAVHSWTDWPLDVYATAPPGQVGLYHVDEATQQVAKEQVEVAARRHPRVAIEWEAVTDRPAHALLERGESARLLVVGSHGRGAVTRALLGSVSHAVLYHAPCPVAVLRDGDRMS